MKRSYTTTIHTTGALKVDLAEHFSKQDNFNASKYEDVIGRKPSMKIWGTQNSEIFHEDWLTYVQARIPVKLIGWSAVFFRPAHDERIPAAHIDVFDHVPCGDYKLPRIVAHALNFAPAQASDAEMIWFERLTEGENLNDISTYVNIPYDQLREVERAVISSEYLTLISTSEYHDVDNKGKDRWCISLRTEPFYDTWEESVEAYSKLIV